MDQKFCVAMERAIARGLERRPQAGPKGQSEIAGGLDDRQAVRNLRQVGAGRRQAAMDGAAPMYAQGPNRLALGLVRKLDQRHSRPLLAREGVPAGRRRATARRPALDLRGMGQEARSGAWRDGFGWWIGPAPLKTPSRPSPRRARRERPRCRAAEQRDELAPLHSITSSARTRID